ncbi:MAG: hypothetical protein ACR2IL_11035 [Chitinophagaceae bacterium]
MPAEQWAKPQSAESKNPFKIRVQKISASSSASETGGVALESEKRSGSVCKISASRTVGEAQSAKSKNPFKIRVQKISASISASETGGTALESEKRSGSECKISARNGASETGGTALESEKRSGSECKISTSRTVGEAPIREIHQSL